MINAWLTESASTRPRRVIPRQAPLPRQAPPAAPSLLSLAGLTLPVIRFLPEQLPKHLAKSIENRDKQT